MIAEAERVFGGIQVLFNNAGVFPAEDGGPEETSEEVWDEVMRVNLKGVFLGCKLGIPALLRAGGGSIVNTASFVALMGAATAQVAYTASKGGVVALTREIAAIYARQNIRANALCPGPVETLRTSGGGGPGGAVSGERRVRLRERDGVRRRRRDHGDLHHSRMTPVGIVITVYRGGCQLVADDRVWDLRLVGRHAEQELALAVGDEVTFDSAKGIVLERLPRRTQLKRHRRRGEQVIAANMDRLAVVASFDEPPFRPGAVDRLLLAAYEQARPAAGGTGSGGGPGLRANPARLYGLRADG
jgi:NAD(P)-dependent dehydrogenase (short-subunit alcohol dehydrogenase family)